MKRISDARNRWSAIILLVFVRGGVQTTRGEDQQTSDKDVVTVNLKAGAITNVAFSPDGSRLAIVCRDKSVRLWNLRTGKDQKVATLVREDDWVFGLAFKPDGKQIVVGRGDFTLQLRDVATGRQQFPARRGFV